MRLVSAFLFIVAVASPCLAQAHNEMRIATPARVSAVAVARSGKIAAGLGTDGRIWIWNLPSGQVVRSLQPSGLGASQACAVSNLPCGLLLSQDGRSLFFGDAQGGVHVWDSSTGEARFETALHHYVITGAFSRDGNLLAASAAGEPAQIFDLRSKQRLFQLTSDFGGATAVAFSPDGSLIASADSDTAIRVFDAHSGKLKWRFDDLTLESFTVDFTADDKFVFAGGASKSLILLDAISGKELRSFPKQKDVVRYVEVSPDGSVVAVEYFDENGANIPAPVMVLDISSGNVRSQWTPDVPIVGTGWIGNGHLLVATATLEALHIWSLP